MRLLSLLLVLAIAIGGYIDSALADGVFHKHRPGAGRVIVFVHGIRPGPEFSKPDETWVSDVGSVPAAIATNDHFSDADVFEVEFTNASANPNSPGIDDLAKQIAGQLRDNGIPLYPHVLFVAHSLGGLIVRELLLQDAADRRDYFARGKVSGLLLLSTPMDGASIANIGGGLFASRTLWHMETSNDPDSFLEGLRSRWIDSPLQIDSRCAFETRGVKLFSFFMINFITPIIVGKHSAGELCNDGLAALPLSHTEMTKLHPEADLDIVGILTSYYDHIFADAGPPLPAGQTVVARCEASDFSDAAAPAIEDVLTEHDVAFVKSKLLPIDWPDTMDASLFVGPAPKRIIIHFSCFQQGLDEDPGSIDESLDDLSRFLAKLPAPTGMPAPQVIVYSRAFVNPDDPMPVFFKKNFRAAAKARYHLDKNIFLVPVRRGLAIKDFNLGLPPLLN